GRLPWRSRQRRSPAALLASTVVFAVGFPAIAKAAARAGMFERRDVCACRWREHFKPQGAGRRDCFEQANFDRIAKTIPGTGPRAHQRMGGFDVVVVVVSEA